MEQTGQFRTSLHGFHKKDVLQYLEQLNNREFTELQEAKEQLSQAQEENRQLREQLEQYEQQLHRSQEDTKTLQTAIDEYVQSAQDRRAEAEELIQLRREKQVWKLKESAMARSGAAAAELQREYAQLKEQCALLQQKLHTVEQQFVAVQKEKDALRQQYRSVQEKSEQHREQIAHIRDFIAEVRAMEQEMVRNCYVKSETELKEMFILMSQWESKATQTKERLRELQKELLAQCHDTDCRLDRLEKEWSITAEE